MRATEVKLTPLAQEHLDWARELRNRFRTSFVHQQEITPEQHQEWFRRYQLTDRDSYTMFVVSDGEQRIGTTSYARMPDGSFELGNNIIDTPYQGRGYFRLIYNAMKAKVDGQPIIATVLDTNHHMIDVYRRLGFTHQGYVKVGVVLLTDGDRPTQTD